MWGFTHELSPEKEISDDTDAEFPELRHRQDATTEAVERLLATMSHGTAPDGLQGPHRGLRNDAGRTQ